MKREIEQIWLTSKLSHIDKKFPNLDYFGPEIASAGRAWKGWVDYDTREIVLKLKTGEGWRTFRAPYDGLCLLYRGRPTKADASDESE
jgi:hypothetical protein